MSDKCVRVGCEARRIPERAFCVEHCIANLEDRLVEIEKEKFLGTSEPEPWKPRTKKELSDAWDLAYQNLGPPLQWSVQARTDEIARMLEEEAEKIGGEGEANPWGYGAKLLRRMARRIRALE